MRKLLTTFALGCMAFAVTAQLPAQAKTFTEIKFGVDATYPPFESLSPSHLRGAEGEMRVHQSGF